MCKHGKEFSARSLNKFSGLSRCMFITFVSNLLVWEFFISEYAFGSVCLSVSEQHFIGLHSCTIGLNQGESADREIVGLAFHHQGLKFINGFCQATTNLVDLTPRWG